MKIEIKQTEWAGYKMYVYVVNGVTSMKMFRSAEAALEAAKAVR